MCTSLTSLLRFRALLLGLLTLGLVACEPNEEPEPCEPTTANAGFKIFEQFSRINSQSEPFLVEVDTAAPTSSVVFRPNDGQQNSYGWRIGNDPRRFTSPEVSLRFPPLLNPIGVSLATTKREVCSGNLTRDSLFKANSLMVAEWGQNDVIGYYQGSTTAAPNDTFTIAFTYRNAFFPIDNFPKGFRGSITGGNPSDPEYGYKKCYVWHPIVTASVPFPPQYLRGLIRFSCANTCIRAEFEVSSTINFSTKTSFTFIGRKL